MTFFLSHRPFFKISGLEYYNIIQIFSYFITAQTAFHHCTFSFITAHFVHHCTLKQALRCGMASLLSCASYLG